MIGIDKGTTYTKTDKRLCIRSTLCKYDDMIPNEKIILELDGQKYTVGEKGSYATDLMKSEHFNTKALVLTAIGLSHDTEDISEDIVVGLPIGQYKNQKQAMKNTFNDRTFEIRLNGRHKSIHIDRAEVFPEAAGAFYSQSEYQDALIIDIGGLSIDVAQFKNNKLYNQNYSTYAMGVMKLFSRLANRLNSAYDLSLTEWDIETILKDGLWINGVETEIGIEEVAQLHTMEIMERLYLEYDLKGIKHIILTGGGSNLLFDYFLKRIPHIRTLPDNQFANALGNFNIGQVLFA